MATQKKRGGKATPARAAKASRKPKPAPKRKPAKSPKPAKKTARSAPKRAAAPKAKASRVKSKPKPAAKPRVSAKPKAKVKPAAKAKPRQVSKPKPKPAPAKPAKAQSPKPQPQSLVERIEALPPEPQSLVERIEALASETLAPEALALEPQVGRDWSETLFLPKTDFPMKAGLPQREPELLERWERLGLYERLRGEGKGRPKFVLHDGPPYANGSIHIGTGLNKILKDVIVRSQSMMGKDANYVPGWDCHGLPIEWKVEEENYRAKGKSKPDLSDSGAMIAFRAECRAYAEHFLSVQREEFKRLGVIGDWQRPYTTMSFDAEAIIAQELTKFAMNGLLYRGSKPVMWSVVERTALAEAEVEYAEIESPSIYVKFPVRYSAGGAIGWTDGSVEASSALGDVARESYLKLQGAFIVSWTTTPWTLPGDRAISFSP
jgi:isoleucyl-tRNA synthetase